MEKEIEIKSNNDKSFVKEISSDISKNFANTLFVDDQICLGIFDPSGGRLKDDLETMINSKLTSNIFDVPPVTSIEEVKEEEIESDPIIQIDKLDFYQRLAVRSAIKDNTIIHGPPGTGKSEVISNIISNVLFNDKNILMVSEKVAALNVLKKRMKSLSIFMLEVYDTYNKNAFFESINKLSKFLGNSWLSKNYSTKETESYSSKLFETINSAKGFKRIVEKLENLKNFKLDNGNNFLSFITAVNSIGGIEVLDELKNTNYIQIIKNIALDNNLSDKEIIEKINDFVLFLEKNKINNEASFSTFQIDIKSLKKVFNDVPINEISSYAKSKLVSANDDLKNFLSSKYNYQKLLKENPFKFFEDIELFKEFKNKCDGLISNKFFENTNVSFQKIRPFFNVYNGAKESDKKFIFDSFINDLEIINKKPLSKIFKSSKFNTSETMILDFLKKIDNQKLYEYENFDEIFRNEYIFNPMNVLYFFDKKIFNSKYIEYFERQFTVFDFNIYSLQKKINIDIKKWNYINQIFDELNIYKEKFPEFVSTNLFNNFLNKYKQIEWSSNCDILVEIIREKILLKLSKLSQEDKKLVEKAINVAASTNKNKEIYQYLSKYTNALKYIFPIWVSRPEQVAIFVPFEKDFFDYGIYDEASQMFLERAYPILYRSKINVIAGDDKQLKPSSFFVSRGEDESDNYDIDDLDVQESLLDRAKSTSWTEVTLQNHYRSQNKDLIKFSSEFIYDNQLNFATKNGFFLLDGIEVVNTNGFFIDNRNEKEAIEVIKAIEENIDKFKSILVITFNAPQCEYIKGLLTDKNYSSSKLIDKFMSQEIELTNIENVQGSEADLVIMSIGYGKKSDNEKLKNSFGSVIQKGGKNRLNVAITRSKIKMIVIKSLNASDISTKEGNPDLNVFRNYISFLDNISMRKNSVQALKNKKPDFDSGFEEEVYNELYNFVVQNNWNILTQFEVGNKRIDIVITTMNFEKVLLGIEVDGFNYHSSKLKMLEDYERQLFLESRGYPIFRVLEFEWKFNKKVIIQKIIEEVRKYENEKS